MAAITVLLLAVCAVGMMAAAVLAVYDYTTPAVEGPLAVGLAAVFAAVLLLNVAASTARHLRRR